MPIIKSLRKPQDQNEKSSYSPPLKITGGDRVYTAGGYTVHLFLTPGQHQFKVETVEPMKNDTMGLIVDRTFEIMMVGAGGAGGGYSGGGGGGEVVYISRGIGLGTFPLNVAPATSGDNSSWSVGKCGTSTTGFGETVKGGGSARASDDSIPSNPYNPVANGGGGSSRTAGYFGQQGTSVGTGVTRYGGFRGGQETSGNDAPNYPGAGGGGAGQSITGNTGGGGNGGAGGSGVALSLTGTSFFWGGGGGGQTYYGGQGGAGGAGGGAAGSGGNGGNSGGAGLNPGGSTGGASTGGSGGANTGGGGGSGNGQNSSSGGGGGSGIVVVRYPT